MRRVHVRRHHQSYHLLNGQEQCYRSGLEPKERQPAVNTTALVERKLQVALPELFDNSARRSWLKKAERILALADQANATVRNAAPRLASRLQAVANRPRFDQDCSAIRCGKRRVE